LAQQLQEALSNARVEAKENETKSPSTMTEVVARV
jgi:hypothetical protein